MGLVGTSPNHGGLTWIVLLSVLVAVLLGAASSIITHRLHFELDSWSGGTVELPAVVTEPRAIAILHNNKQTMD